MSATISTTNEQIQGNLAESERLGRLTTFLDNFAPMIGQTRGEYSSGEMEVSNQVERAREDAVVEAFRAVARIARNSFIPAKEEPANQPHHPNQSVRAFA